MNKTTKIVDVAADVAALATPKKKPPRAGMGRPKGVKNKNTKALKDMILGQAEPASLYGVDRQSVADRAEKRRPGWLCDSCHHGRAA
jgi:hypothetical protein